MIKGTANTLLSLAVTATASTAQIPEAEFSESAVSQEAYIYHLNLFRDTLKSGAITNNEQSRFIPISFLEEPEEESLWDIIDAIAAEIPEEEWDKIPTDFSENLDKYLYSSKV